MLLSTEPPIKLERKVLFLPWLKRPGRHAKEIPPASVEFKDGRAIHLPSYRTHGIDRDVYDQLKKNEMGRTRSTFGERTGAYRILVGDTRLKGKTQA
jgi:hypothetical protein